MKKKEMEEEIKKAMRGVWDYIAGDTMTMIQEQDGRNYATRDEVIEMVCDAGRTEECLEPETREYYRALGYKKVIALAKEEFKSARYC